MTTMQKAVQNPALRAFFLNSLGAAKQFRSMSMLSCAVHFKPVVSPPTFSACSSFSNELISLRRISSKKKKRKIKKDLNKDAEVAPEETIVRIPLCEFLSEHPPSDTLSSQTCRLNECLKEGKIELRFLIPRAVLDALTDAGDAFLNSLKDKYSASLELMDWKKPEGVLTLICRQKDVVDCFMQILPQIMSNRNDRVNLLINNRHCWLISGDLGQRRRKMLKDNNIESSQFRIIPYPVPFCSDRVIVLKGEESVMAICMQLIMSRIKSRKIEGVAIPYNSQSYQGALKYGGYGGRDIRENRNPLQGVVSSYNSESSEGTYNDDGETTDHEGREYGQSMFRITIPQDILEPIMNVADSFPFNYKNIRRKSGVDIRNNNEDGRKKMTGLRIQGLPEQIEMCMFLFKQALESFTEGKAYLGGSVGRA